SAPIARPLGLARLARISCASRPGIIVIPVAACSVLDPHFTPATAREPGEYGRCRGIVVITPRRLLHRLRFWRGWGRELPAEIDRRLRPLEEAGEKQVIIDIWVLRQLLSRPPGIAAERPIASDLKVDSNTQ